MLSVGATARHCALSARSTLAPARRFLPTAQPSLYRAISIARAAQLPNSIHPTPTASRQLATVASSISPNMSGIHSSGASAPVWLERDDLLSPETKPTYPALASDTETDVLVVGAGVAGLHIAYELLSSGTKKVIVVDDGKIGSGETGRTTGHLSCDNEYNDFLSMHGKEKTAEIAAAQQAAIERIAQIVAKHKMDCDFERVPGYMFHGLAPSDKSYDEKLLHEVYDAAAGTGKLDVTLVDDALIPGFTSGPAIRFGQQGTYHATKYVKALAAAVTELGGTIYETTHVADFSEKSGDATRGVTATTADGKTITADALVMATNAPLQKLMVVDRIEAFRSYAVAFKVKTGAVAADPAVQSALWWDMADPYHYIRVTPHKDPGYSLLVVGGEDDKVGQHGDFAERYDRLVEWTTARWSSVTAGDVEYKWSGQVHDSVDGIAYIGRNPGNRHIYVHTGDNGDGLTYAAIGGLLLSDLINGRETSWAHTFSPSRQHSPSHLRQAVKSIPDYLMGNLSDQVHFAKWITTCSKTMTDIEDLVPGEGEVVRDGIHPVACYKDEGGKVHKMTAVCPHLKGIVVWNTEEKSFDCPIHGSRFTCKGAVTMGPAKAGLEARD